MLFYPKFSDIKYRTMKGILFFILGIFDLVPIFHLIFLRYLQINFTFY